MVNSASEVSSMAINTRVAGTAKKIRITNGSTVQTISTATFSWKVEGSGRFLRRWATAEYITRAKTAKPITVQTQRTIMCRSKTCWLISVVPGRRLRLDRSVQSLATLTPLTNNVVSVVAKQRNSVDCMLVNRKSTRLNSSHVRISYAVFCLKKKKKKR